MTSSPDRTSLDPDVLRRSAAEIGELMDDMSSLGRLNAAGLRPGDFPAAARFQAVLQHREGGIVQHTNDLRATLGKIARDLKTVAQDLEAVDHGSTAAVRQLTEDTRALNDTLTRAEYEPGASDPGTGSPESTTYPESGSPAGTEGPGGGSPAGTESPDHTGGPGGGGSGSPGEPNHGVFTVSHQSPFPPNGSPHGHVVRASTGGLQRPDLYPVADPLVFSQWGPRAGSPREDGQPGRTRPREPSDPASPTEGAPAASKAKQEPAAASESSPAAVPTSSTGSTSRAEYPVTYSSGGGAGVPSHTYPVSVPGGGGWSMVPPSGDVADWIREAIEILRANGVNVSDADAALIATIIQHESGGDPNAINNWDSNAAAGHPSMGLMQTIDTTFDAYKLPGHDVINNPVDNIIAGVRYAISRYGSLNGVPGIQGLADGGGYVGY
ncbi:transglycosylase SLT domain-containing protein [Amycolatopsis samaneae]|uniref:Transglycosylase SLT domain-containing protein n=1 Tax=Amycolatopsis samaneae TaxID=664691 RepID=A0ABW5GRC2_9PSEU